MNAPSDTRAATRPALPPGVRRVAEERFVGDGVSARVHPGWAEEFAWLVQGTTDRGEEAEAADFGLFGRAAAGAVQARWERLSAALGMPRLVHGRQVHGAAVRMHAGGPPGLHLVPATDGHVTRAPGVLLTVSVADCVPVSMVDPVRRAVAILHAGWRGVASGILERGLESLQERVASRTRDLHIHLGPAICGRCNEVGAEVHEALGLDPPGGPAPVDLRAILAGRAVEGGVAADRITVSSWCTLCGDTPFFSHRGRCAERQVGFVGLLP